jgi:cobalt-zinc-cadmium efflux system membrane fusion protein
MDEEVMASGLIAYKQSAVAQLTTRVPGSIWRVEKQVGDVVRKGEVVAIIEAVGVGEAKATFLQALVARNLALLTSKRLREAGGGIVPERQINESEASTREAQIRLFNAQQTLINLGLPVRLEDVADLAEVQLKRHMQFLGLPTALAEGLSQETTTANLVPLVAPFAGIVIGHDMTVGEFVTTAATALTIADNSRMWINLKVNKEAANRLRLGQEVAFQPDGVSEVVIGQVDWISTEVDPKTRTVTVRAEVDNPLLPAGDNGRRGPRLLLANAFGTGVIRIRPDQQVVAVPTESVQREGSQYVVFVKVDAQTFEARKVMPGVAADDFTELISGIAPGEQVIQQGSHVLKSELLRTRLVDGD